MHHFTGQFKEPQKDTVAPDYDLSFRDKQDLEAVLQRVVSLEDDGTSEVLRLSEKSFLEFWTALRQLDGAADYVAGVLRRIDELEGHGGATLLSGNQPSLTSTSSGKPHSGKGRSWTFGLIFKTAEKQLLPGSPLRDRSFQLPPPRVRSYEFRENVKAGLVNTVLMIALYQQIDFSRIPAVYEKARHSQPGRSWRQTVLFFLKALIENHKEILVTALTMFAAYISSPLAVLDNSMLACGWIYIWLIDHVLRGDEHRIHEALVRSLSLFVEEKTKIITPAHEFQVTCVLFLARQVLSLTLVPEAILTALEEHVQHLTFWTHPVGYHASLTLYNILQEKKAPGHALRRRSFLHDTRLAPCPAPSPNIGYHVLVNECCSGSVLLASFLNCNRILQRRPTWEGDLNKIRDLKTLMIYQMLRHSGAHELAREATERSVIRTLHPAAFAKFFEAVVELHEEVSEMESVQEAREYRKNKMVQLWRDMVEAHMNIGPWKSKAFTSFHEFTAASLDPLPLTILKTTFSTTPCPAATEEKPGDWMHKEFPIYYPNTSSQELLNQVLRFANANTQIVRVLVAGGDESLQSLLLGYMKLVIAGSLAGGLTMPMRDIVFYVLPTGESDILATFIAQRDLWYDANIYRPVKSRLPIIPYVRSSVAQVISSDTDSGKLSETVPGILLTRQIENFILEADCILKVTVFNCEAWFKDGKHMCTIPFCSRAEIGTTEAGTSSSCKEEYSECIPRRGAEKIGKDIEVKVSYQQVNWDRSLRLQRQEAVRLGALAAVNVPRALENRLECNPRDQLLNICMLDRDGMKKNKVKTYDEFIRSCITFKTKRLIVESSAGFDVTLDGQTYGPFKRIRLLPSVHPYDKQYGVKFMVGTFWPTEIDRESS